MKILDTSKNESLKILLVVHHWPPDVNSTGLLMSSLFSGFAAKGFGVSVITTFPHYEGFRIWPQYRRRFIQRSWESGIKVTRVYSHASGRKSMFQRLLNYLTFNLMALIVCLSSWRRLHIIFCTNGSFFSGVTGWVVSRLRSARCVYNIQDLYPEVPVVRGELTKRWQINWLGRIERFMYRHADHLVVITPAFRENLIRKGVAEEKISVIPNFVDVQFIRPMPRANSFSEKHKLDQLFIVSHSGNLGYVYDLFTLLEAAALLRVEREILVLIVGDGVAKPELESRALQLALSNVRFLPFQPIDEVPLLRAASDVQVALYKRHAAEYSMPSKIYEIMASGRPALVSAEPDSDIRQLVEAEQCGLGVAPGDAQALSEAILRLYNDPELRKSLGANGRNAAETRFSKPQIAEQYEALFKRVVAEKASN